jgi:hypothetical protein
MPQRLKIEVSHYLNSMEKIDLVGRSRYWYKKIKQCLRSKRSGLLERDQQGQSNKFNYNYWGSPVGVLNATTTTTTLP